MIDIIPGVYNICPCIKGKSKSCYTSISIPKFAKCYLHLHSSCWRLVVCVIFGKKIKLNSKQAHPKVTLKANPPKKTTWISLQWTCSYPTYGKGKSSNFRGPFSSASWRIVFRGVLPPVGQGSSPFLLSASRPATPEYCAQETPQSLCCLPHGVMDFSTHPPPKKVGERSCQCILFMFDLYIYIYTL